MPRYPVSTFLNEAQKQKVEEAANIAGLSKYKLMREALMIYCEAIIKEKNKIDRGKIGLEKRRSGNSEEGSERAVERTKPPFIPA